MGMLELNQSELLFGGGIILMAIAAVLTIVCIIVFCITKQKLKKKLEQEYGKLQ